MEVIKIIKLTIDNIYITMSNISSECELEIWNKLCFEIEEFGTQNIRIRHLYNRKTKKTYTGLLSYVIDILDMRGEEYEIIDKRVVWEQNANFKLVDFIDDEKTIPFKLRPYQQEIIDNLSPRECIQAATGAGKTAMLAAAIAKFNCYPVSIFADKLTLCTQLKSEISKFLGVEVGIVGGGLNEIKDITVYSIQSATEEAVKDSKIIMFDECLDGDTEVTMWDGSKVKIRDIVENKINSPIKTYNIDTKKFEAKDIYDFAKKPLNNKKMMKITIEDNNGDMHIIKCTEDHKIWIESKEQYIEAKKLTKNMKVICEEIIKDEN